MINKKFNLWMLAAILLCGPLFTACVNDDSPAGPSPEDRVEEMLKKMTLREKIGQLLFVRPEGLDTTIHWTQYSDLPQYELRTVNDVMKGVNKNYPVGGIILYAWNIDDEAQLAQFIPQLKQLNGSPLLCIDEEGGRVARIANNPNFHVKKYESMTAIGNTGDPANAYECGNTIGTYLRGYGFDVDFAPVADVNTNPDREYQPRQHHHRHPCLQRRSSGGCTHGNQLSRGTEGCWHHRLYQALPRSWRCDYRYPLRLCPDHEDVGRDARLRDHHLPRRHRLGLSDGDDRPHQCA